ncbi:MAG: hypothetical protein ACD_2C00082G0001 [uncultured bacterium (gcode 4)]|uniref:Uncharacterized protein n=1 Tax=uncultured bacterium (gcode 4) TaxID=1234023 RepID=K2G3P7_9BACT|nr:MAG: hypothetical protein ACD_2C00082G0001 [uncultured bacterium (gcode 4)]
MALNVKSLLIASSSRESVKITSIGFLWFTEPISFLNVVISYDSPHSLTIRVQYFDHISHTTLSTLLISSGLAAVVRSMSAQKFFFNIAWTL